jgi:pyrophosphatase PpaX
MSRLKAIIFDVDGVLVDSRAANGAFYIALLEKAGYPKPSRTMVDMCFHLPMWQAIERLTDSQDQVEIGRIWQLGHGGGLYPTHLLKFPPSLVATLATLHEHYRLAVVTGRIREGLETVFSASGITHFFDVTVVFEDYSNPKPHPEPLQIALRKLDLKPDEAVYIGDSLSDIEAAKAAGMRSIHLAPEKHKKASVGITDFEEVSRAIEKIEGSK